MRPLPAGIPDTGADVRTEGRARTGQRTGNSLSPPGIAAKSRQGSPPCWDVAESARPARKPASDYSSHGRRPVRLRNMAASARFYSGRLLTIGTAMVRPVCHRHSRRARSGLDRHAAMSPGQTVVPASAGAGSLRVSGQTCPDRRHNGARPVGRTAAYIRLRAPSSRIQLRNASNTGDSSCSGR